VQYHIVCCHTRVNRCCTESDQVWQNNAQRPLSPISNGKSRSVDTRPAAAAGPATGAKARASTSESRDVASPVPQVEANTSKPVSMLNRFKLFNSRDRMSAGTPAVQEVNGVAVHPSSTSPAPKRLLPTYSSQKGNGSQFPSHTAGTFPVDGHRLPQPTQSASNGRYGSAGIGSPGRPQHQRAPPPPERHVSPGLQESRRGRALPAGPSSDQYAGDAAPTNSFGFGSGSSNRYQQQRAIPSRCSADRGAGSHPREIFIDQLPGGGDDAGVMYDGSRSPSSSVPSRTASSTSISSIASNSTTSGAAPGARRSGLARRVSSSAQPDKRNAKSAVPAAAASSNSRVKSARSSSSSTSIPAPSTPGSINRAAAKQSAASGETGAARRQRGSTTKTDGASSSASTAETTSTEHGSKAARGLIPRCNSSRVGQLTDKGDVMSPGSGRKLPQVANNRRSATPDRETTNSSTPTSDVVTTNRKLTADSSTSATSPSKASRMPQPSVSAVTHPAAGVSDSAPPPPPTSPRLSVPATTSGDSPDVERRRQIPVGHPTTPVSVTAPPSPAISGQAAMHRSASVGRPTKEKSSSSISSGFGDESNNSTSDSADSVIFQSTTSASHPSASRVTAAPSSTKNSLCESSSSAIDSDSPPFESTAGRDIDCAPTSSSQSPPPTHQTVDHITSLRGSRRQSSEDLKSPAPSRDDAATPGGDVGTCETTRTTELIDAFDCIKPMQPLVRSSIPCCVYEPSTRRLPTLLAQSAGGSASRRLVFSRPPIGTAVVTAGGRGALGGRSGARESPAACGYMSDGDVVRGGGSGSAAVSRTTDRLMSGYTSEGGGGAGVTSYARRMQQRFLEGILAVRQSMERAPQFTDDDRSDAFHILCN